MMNNSQTVMNTITVIYTGAPTLRSSIFDYKRPEPWLIRLYRRTVRRLSVLLHLRSKN